MPTLWPIVSDCQTGGYFVQLYEQVSGEREKAKSHRPKKLKTLEFGMFEKNNNTAHTHTQTHAQTGTHTSL